MNNRRKNAYYAIVTSLLLSQTVLAKEIGLGDKVQTCSEISQDSARLACFDQLTLINSSTTLEPQLTELTAKEVDAFSKGHVKKTAEEKTTEILSLSLTINKLEKTARGKWKITFNNGQKWQQKDTTSFKLKEGDVVTLSKGALSSVYLKKENMNKRIKVKRLK